MKSQVFPTELEREVFEWTAIAYPSEILVLLRVARRVHLWMEPYLYRVVQVCPEPPYSILRDAILRPAPQSKPADFYRNAVRHVYLDSISPWSPQVLQVCTRTRTFAAAGNSSRPILLAILLEMDLRHLSLSLRALFGGAEYIEMNHPVLSSITHLDIFDDITEADSRIWLHLNSLPALTHLCLNDHVPGYILRMVLSLCPRLQVLANIWQFSLSSESRRLTRNTPLKDARFVVGVYRDYGSEWAAGARGGPDFWSAAENFIARKCSGAIPESRYYIQVRLLRSHIWSN
ncbi:hypothetical protein B0H13DRAFT_2138227 [Mycena leptocephala]|nr:hypothetical protein B0H13DRAFT_2138227 [Mycena leptocephala]